MEKCNGISVLDEKKMYNCANCSNSYARRDSWSRHQRFCGKPRFSCSHCHFKAKLKSSLELHMARHGTMSERKAYTCANCSNSYARRDSYYRHSRSCVKTKLSCTLCSYQTRCPNTLTDHTRRFHNGMGVDDLVMCSFCPFKTTVKRNLARHFRRIHSAANEVSKLV